MPRRRTVRGLTALSDEELDAWRRGQGGSAERVFLRVDDPDNMTEELKERIRKLYRRKATEELKAAGTDRKQKEPPAIPEILMGDGPYAEVDPPYESTLLNAISPSTYNPQEKCPLFTRLNAELRLEIFSYVLAEYQDWSKQYEPEDGHEERYAIYYRPGWDAPWVINLDLLYTCRRVYAEASHMPMKLAVIRNCYDIPSPPRGHCDNTSRIGHVRTLAVTRHNLQNVTNMHIQTSRYGLQNGREPFLFWEWENYRGPDPFPNLETLTITLGWSQWFPHEPGALDYGEFGCDDWPEVKKYLRLEFETDLHLESHAGWVDETVEELRGGRLKFQTINGTPLVPDLRKAAVKRRRILEFPEVVYGSDFLNYRIGYDHPNAVELETTMVDYVPGREPRLRKDLVL